MRMKPTLPLLREIQKINCIIMASMQRLKQAKPQLEKQLQKNKGQQDSGEKEKKDGIQRSLSTGTLKQKKKKERQLEHGRSLESIEDIAQDHGLYIQTDKLNASHINSIEEEDGKTDNEVPSIPSVQACRHSAQDTNVPLEANQISSIEDSLVKTPSVLDDETTSKSDSGFASPMDLQQQRLEVDEVIPPLIQRLSAMGVAPMAGALETDTMSAPETSVRGLLAGATRHGRNLLSVKDRVSSKISNTTKSLIKRVKEKNLLPSRSPSGSPPSGNYLNLPSPHAEVAGSVAHTSTVRRSGTAEDSDNLDPEAKVDLASFWSKTVQTQKELEKPNILLNAERLKLVLNSWAYELNKALLTYHNESYKKLEEKMKEGENLEETGKSSEKTYIDDQMTKKEIGETSGLIEITEEGIKTISTNKEASKESQEDTELVFATESEQKILDQSKLGGEAVDVIQIKSVEDGGPQSGMSASPKLVHVVRRNTDPSLVEVKTERNKWSVERDSETGVLMKDWSEVCHTHDPFHFSQQKHMTVSALALHCLRAGCFGNILSVFPSQLAGPETIHSNPMSSFSSACTNSKPSFQFHDGDPLPFADQSLNLASDQNSCNHNFSGSNSTPSDLYVSKLSEGGSSGDKEVSQEGLAPDEGASQADSSALDMYKTDLNQDLANKDYNETSADAETSLVTNSADQQEHKDMERALFVQLHYHLLPHWRVRRLVTETEGDDVYHTWCSLITCYKSLGKGDIVWVKLSERDVTGALDYLRSGILPHKLSFLGHLASAFALSPLRVVEFATEVPRQVTLRDVLYLCRLLNKPRLQVVTRYLTLFLTPVVEHKRLEVVQQMCKMLEAKQVVLECLLSLHTAQQSVTTTEGFFSGGADSSRLHPNDVEKMLSAVLSLVTDSELPYMLDMCWHHRHWGGCLKLLTRSDQWKQALQLIIELNDLSLLDGTKDYGFMPRSIDEWRYLLQLYREKSYIRGQTSPVFSGHKVAGTKQEPPPFHSVQDERKVPERAARNVFQEECLSPKGSGTNLQNKMEEIAHSTDTLLSPVVDGAHAPATTRPQRSHSAPDFKVWSLLQDEKPQMSSSHQSISWTGLGLLAARHIGALRAVELLEGCFGDQGDQDSAAGGLSEEFYAQCIAISGIQKRQKLVIHNMLEKVDSYLWAKKPVHIPPQVHYAVMQEKAAQESGKSGGGNYQDLFAKLSSVPLSNLPLAEDPDCHWGVVTNMNSLCQICQVNVTETVSHMEPGVLVFRCGHVFHKFCVPDQVCPLC
ncbi:uncharacterized protein LOC112559969 isoform X2 [Pomacea canaliculata]|uniref:uncharacterized protein LOC112559969 isoform X2 n=1 Tax=Pomacea canaliculata TaxID=400727 RepID=UPI000D731981|nr:uncharacterized protein LOC112559969 isoform X2 [Pomacea canaliculata]